MGKGVPTSKCGGAHITECGGAFPTDSTTRQAPKTAICSESSDPFQSTLLRMFAFPSPIEGARTHHRARPQTAALFCGQSCCLPRGSPTTQPGPPPSSGSQLALTAHCPGCTCMHACVCLYACVHVRAQVDVCLQPQALTAHCPGCTCMHACMCVCLYACVHVRAQVDVCLQPQAHNLP